MDLSTLRNFSKGKKIIVFLSIIWSFLGFIVSAFISDSPLGFMACFMAITFPVWIYWVGFCIWGDGYVLRFVSLAVRNPLKSLVNSISNFIRKINTLGWVYIVCFTSSVGVSFYFLNATNNVNSAQVGILVGQYFIPLLICIGSIKEKNKHRQRNLFVLGLFLFILFIVLRIDYRSYLADLSVNKRDKLEADVAVTNRVLPMMIDDSTRMDNISIQGENIFYNYTLVDTNVENLDIPNFETAMRPSIKNGACSEKTLRVLLNDDRVISYVYQDKYGKLISTIAINKKDCL